MLETSATFDRHRRRVVPAARTALAALLVLGCSEATTARDARPMKANMSVSATISSQSATQVLLVALYSSVPLDSSQLSQLVGPVAAGGNLGMQLVDLTSASAQLVPMSIDLGHCFADPKVSPNTGVCPYVYVEAFLLTGQNTIDPNNPTGFNGNNLLDVDLVGPFAVSLNATATTPRALVLHEVQSISVLPTRLSLQIGQTSSLAATVLDLYGKPVAGRTATWSSGNNLVATVNASGLVTALTPGNTSITASTGGRSTVVPVSVQLPGLVLSPNSVVAFLATNGSIPSIAPKSAAITVSSSGGAAAPITLASPTTTYGIPGVSWLNVSLNTSTTPATLNIVPGNLVNLPLGAYSATITLRSTNTAIASTTLGVTLSISIPATGSITVSNIGRP